MQGDEQDRDVVTGFGDFSGCFYAIHPRHHQYDVGSKLVSLYYRIGPVHSLATDEPV